MKEKIPSGGNRLIRVLLLLFLAFQLPVVSFAQESGNVVKGVVVSGTDQTTLPGVSIMIKGTSSGVSTDIDGRFTLTLPEPTAVLHFSFIGFKPQDVNVSAGQELKIVMEEEIAALDEVVVVGYGVQKKKLTTGATVQVKGEALQKQNTVNPLLAMQGQTPGVSIASTSGQPGSDMKVTIRGLGTVGNASPLYLIDGVGGDISTLNPADIESIDVLKDAASAAIYGAQAANGVVLITTKQGREGKAQVSFDAYYGIQNVARKAKMLNAAEYKMIMDEQALNSGSSAYNWDGYKSIYTYNYDKDGNLISKDPIDTDWVDAMIADNTKTQSYTLGVSGGSKTSTYAMSLGYMEQEGVIGGPKVSDYERYNFRVNSEHKLFGNLLKVGEQVSFVYKKTRGISVGNQYNNTLRGAFATSPLSPVYSDNNKYDSPYNDTSESDWYNADGNPYGKMMTNTNNQNQSRLFSGNFYAEIEPVKNLRIRSVFGAVYSSSEYRSYSPLYQFSVYDQNNTRTSVSQNMNTGTTLTWTNTATYDWRLGEHAFTALAGMEASRYEGTYLGAGNGTLKDGFADWGHAWLDNTTGTGSDTGMSVSGKPHDESRNVSYFARLNWNWKERYMLNATFRADGSSRFASGNRFGYFPSVSAGWVVSNESFMDDTKGWLDFMKVRASWGQVGNQNIDNYQYMAPITNSGIYYLFGTAYGADAQQNYWGAYPSRLANEDIKWETSEQYNVGLDMRFLNKLDVNADFYIKKTKDWLVEAPILATVGTGAPFINGGDVKNTGVELSLVWNDRIGSDFHYTVGVNGAWNKNEVGKIPTEDGIIHGQINQLYDNTPEFYRAQNGHAIGYFWGYQTCGVFQNKNEIAQWNADGKHGILQSDPQPGDVKYVDQDHNGVIDEKDKVDLGCGMPDYTFGFNVGFDWKGLDFSVVGTGMAGNKIVQSYRNHANKQANYTTAILDRWTGEGTSNRLPRVTEQNVNWQFSDLYIQDGDFLRISNITLGYDFSKLIRGKWLSQLRVYAQVQNPFTFTKYDGMDPEIGYGTNDWVSGVDLGYYPRPTTVLFGVNLKF